MKHKNIVQTHEKSVAQIDPTVYALTNIRLQAGKDHFLLLAEGGKRARQYFLTLMHAKKLMILLQNKIQEHEKTHGVIKALLPDPRMNDWSSLGIKETATPESD